MKGDHQIACRDEWRNAQGSSLLGPDLIDKADPGRLDYRFRASLYTKLPIGVSEQRVHLSFRAVTAFGELDNGRAPSQALNDLAFKGAPPRARESPRASSPSTRPRYEVETTARWFASAGPMCREK